MGHHNRRFQDEGATSIDATNVPRLRLEGGAALWSYDTWRECTAVNGLPAHGAAIDVHGPALAGDMLFLTSGYRSFGQKGGNAFLAFQLEGGSR